MKPNTPTPRLSNSLVFMFKDDFWFSKVFVGGLVFLLSAVLVGIFLLIGYLIELMNGFLHDNETLPEWRHSGRFFSHGIRLVFALAVYAVPFAALNVLYHSAWIIAGSIVVLLIASPVFAAQYAFRFLLRDCFDWKSILTLVLRTPLFFLCGVLISYGTVALSISLGWMMLIIGWPFVVFWGMLVQSHMFATLKKQSL